MRSLGPSRSTRAIALMAFMGPASPSIVSLTPSSTAGTTLTLTLEGTGFDPASSVPEVYSPDGHRLATGSVSVRSSTRIVSTVNLAGASPGSYTVRVLNPGEVRSPARALTLLPEVSVSPRSGRAGAVFTYAGRGFTGGFGVTSHLQRPDGREFPSKRIGASAQGTFEEDIQSWEFVPGTYKLWAVDDYTRVSTPPVSFEVEAPRP